MDRRVTPPKRVTSPTWGPPPPGKQASSVDSSFPMLRGWWITPCWYSLALMALRSEKKMQSINDFVLRRCCVTNLLG